MLSEKIKLIQDDIKNLENISGFKKIVAEHTRINGEVQSCITYLNQLTQVVDVCENNNDNENIELTDDQYNEHIEYLKTVCDIFDQLDNVEDQIPIYIEAMKKVKAVDKYLETRKLEIVNV